MASKLYFHGHPINRKEAKDDLKVKIAENVQPEVETAIWDLYLSYEKEFENTEVFDPSSLLWGLPPAHQGQQPAPSIEAEFVHAMIESSALRSSHCTKHRYTQLALAPGQIAVRDDLLSQGWNHSPAPKE